MPTTIFQVGEKFAHLTVITALQKGPRRYIVRCDCGNEREVYGHSLRPGHTMSCGCYMRRMKRAATHKVTHGEGRDGKQTAEYKCWKAIKTRCTNPRQATWKNYGGRGITINERWMNSYPDFLAHMGRKPSAKHSIDRIDVNGNYEPGNVRWATSSEQRRNQRKRSWKQ